MSDSENNRAVGAALGGWRHFRWQSGPYSLGRLFLSFYVLLMGVFVAIALSADALIATALKSVSDDYARRYMQGTISLIETELERASASQWPAALKRLNGQFAYPLKIEERGRLVLDERELAALDAGQIVVQEDGDMMLHRLGKTRYALVVGPLDPDANPKVKQHSLPLELRMRLLTWSLIGIGVAVALWFWIRLIWRDLESLRRTAQTLGEGDFSVRSQGRFSQMFAPLAATFDGMAERIQHLMVSQRDLSSAISHELRTPIARLRFAAEMVQDADERAERERLAVSMDRDLAELDKLIDTSLVYARFERETPQLDCQPEALGPWLLAERDALRCLADGKQLSTGEMTDVRVAFDRKVMAHAVSNLLRNAMKYAAHAVSISASVEGGWAEFRVDDDGPGVPPAERENIFAAFTRLDRARDRATGGYGLGLAIARRVLEMHGGSLHVTDSPLGGACFVARFPAGEMPGHVAGNRC